MEEDLAFCINSMQMQYSDFMVLPYSRRQRLIQWKRELLERQKAEHEKALQGIRSQRKRTR